jgi:cytochrome c
MAAIIVALLAAKVFDIIGDNLVAPVTRLAKNVLVVAIPENGADTNHTEKEKVLAPIAPLLVAANVENGEKIFKKCLQCHVKEKGQASTIGPNLWGVVGRAIASAADYSYSSALKEKAASVWDVETINKFIYNPRKFANGTKMTFIGIEEDKDRADVIAYLQKFGS